MNDYYLRTNTEAQMVRAFADIGISVKKIDGECHTLDGQRIDIGWIGPVFLPITNGEDPTIEEPPLVDNRFHVNLRVAESLTEDQLAVLPIIDPEPSQPMRVWA
jgi:hypothetical protein